MSNHNLNLMESQLDQIEAEKIDLVVQVGFPYVLKIKAGDRIRLRKRHRAVWVSVKDVRVYPSFEKMLEKEDASRILANASRGWIQLKLSESYGSHHEAKGVYVFEIEKEIWP